MATSSDEPFWHHRHSNGCTSIVVQHRDGCYTWGAWLDGAADSMCRSAHSLEAAMIAADMEVSAKTGHQCMTCQPWVGW